MKKNVACKHASFWAIFITIDFIWEWVGGGGFWDDDVMIIIKLGGGGLGGKVHFIKGQVKVIF